MEKSILSIVADNPKLLEAVKEVFVKQFDLEKVSIEQTNEEMGQSVRARIVGLKMVDSALSEILTYKTLKEEKDAPMPAR